MTNRQAPSKHRTHRRDLLGAMSSFYPLALALNSHAEPRMTSPSSECSLITKETHKFGKILTEEAVEEPNIILKEKTIRMIKTEIGSKLPLWTAREWESQNVSLIFFINFHHSLEDVAITKARCSSPPEASMLTKVTSACLTLSCMMRAYFTQYTQAMASMLNTPSESEVAAMQRSTVSTSPSTYSTFSPRP